MFITKSLQIYFQFREKRFVMSADIKGETKRLCFFWREHQPDHIATYEYSSFLIVGAKDSPICAFYALQRTDNATDNEEKSALVSRFMKLSFLLDNLLCSFGKTQEGRF